jgi:Mce-associated membrane protein
MTTQADRLETAVEPDPEDLPGPDTDGPSEPAGSTPDRRRRLVIVLLLVAALGLGGAGTWFLVRAYELRASAAANNRALVDPGATAELTASVTQALNRIFSYAYDRTEVTEQAATEVLRGPALDTYHQLFGEVRKLAPTQKLVLTTRVTHIAVQYLAGDRGQLLAFLDQSATRVDNNTTSAAAAQLSVTAKHEGNKWVITDLVPR